MILEAMLALVVVLALLLVATVGWSCALTLSLLDDHDGPRRYRKLGDVPEASP